MIVVYSLKNGSQAAAMLDLQKSVICDLFWDFCGVELWLEGVLMGVGVNRTFDRMNDTIFVAYLSQLLFLLDIDWGILDPSVECISFGRFLRMENCIFEDLESLLFLNQRLLPPLKVVLLGHVMTALERKCNNFSACENLLISQRF